MKIGTEEKMTLLLGLEQLRSNGEIDYYHFHFGNMNGAGETIRVTTSLGTDFSVYTDYDKEPSVDDDGWHRDNIEAIYSQCYAALECATEKGSEF